MIPRLCDADLHELIEKLLDPYYRLPRSAAISQEMLDAYRYLEAFGLAKGRLTRHLIALWEQEIPVADGHLSLSITPRERPHFTQVNFAREFGQDELARVLSRMPTIRENRLSVFPGLPYDLRDVRLTATPPEGHAGLE